MEKDPQPTVIGMPSAELSAGLTELIFPLGELIEYDTRETLVAERAAQEAQTQQ